MSDINTLILAHWNAKIALDAAKATELSARMELAKHLSDGAERFSNKTMALSGGWKLRQEVQRKLNADKQHEDYKMLPTVLGTKHTNDVIKPKTTVEFSMTGYKNLPEDVKSKVAHLFYETDTVSIKYDPPKDDR